MCRILLQPTKVTPVSSPFLGDFEPSCPRPRLGVRDLEKHKEQEKEGEDATDVLYPAI